MTHSRDMKPSLIYLIRLLSDLSLKEPIFKFKEALNCWAYVGT